MRGPSTGQTGTDPFKVRCASSISAIACFAAWTIFSIIGLEAKVQLCLSETEFGLLVGVPILSGSIARVPLGVWADRFGGRRVFAAAMVVAALATCLLSLAESYGHFLFAGIGIGIAGGAFAAGISYISRFSPPQRRSRSDEGRG